jgi:hypothetical protein
MKWSEVKDEEQFRPLRRSKSAPCSLIASARSSNTEAMSPIDIEIQYLLCYQESPKKTERIEEEEESPYNFHSVWESIEREMHGNRTSRYDRDMPNPVRLPFEDTISCSNSPRRQCHDDSGIIAGLSIPLWARECTEIRNDDDFSIILNAIKIANLDENGDEIPELIPIGDERVPNKRRVKRNSLNLKFRKFCKKLFTCS